MCMTTVFGQGFDSPQVHAGCESIAVFIRQSGAFHQTGRIREPPIRRTCVRTGVYDRHRLWVVATNPDCLKPIAEIQTFALQNKGVAPADGKFAIVCHFFTKCKVKCNVIKLSKKRGNEDEKHRCRKSF